MSSGVQCTEDVVEAWDKMKLKRTYGYLICKINMDAGAIELETRGEPHADVAASKTTYENEFLSALPEKEGRFCLYDFQFTIEDGGVRMKPCFILWAPDDAPIKQKMLYASSKDAIKKKLTGIAAEVQGTDMDEVQWDTVIQLITK
eukprot:m.1637074 g.1637074  ORF g.1637074 m.1637074 type:complete len:146 (+) comp25433_c0_seq1:131-568(+)